MKQFLYSALIGITALTIAGGTVALAQGYGFGGPENSVSKAEILSLTVEELGAQLETKTYAELLDEAGVTHTQMQEQMQVDHQARAEERLQEMVDNGTITQEEMDQRLENVADGIEQQGPGKGMVGMHGRGINGSMNGSNGDGVCDYQDQTEKN